MKVRLEIVRCKSSMVMDAPLEEWLKANNMTECDSITLTGGAKELLARLEKDPSKNEKYIAFIKDFIETNSKAKYGSYDLVLRLK